MSKVAFIGNRPLNRVRHRFHQRGVEFAQIRLREQRLSGASTVSPRIGTAYEATIVENPSGQGKSAALTGYFEQIQAQMGSRPDIWVLDGADLFSEQIMSSYTTGASVSVDETLIRELTTRLNAERTPLLLIITTRFDLSEIHPFLESGIADFVRLSDSEATEDIDVDEDDSQEIYERIQVLLGRMHSHILQEEQRPSVAQSPLMTPVHLVADLYDPASGRLDAVRIAQFFGVSQAALGRSLGVLRATLNKTPDAIALQPSLQHWAYVAGGLQELVGNPQNARIWLNTPNPGLEGRTPLSLMQEGEADIVASVVRDALMGQPA